MSKMVFTRKRTYVSAFLCLVTLGCHQDYSEKSPDDLNVQAQKALINNAKDSCREKIQPLVLISRHESFDASLDIPTRREIFSEIVRCSSELKDYDLMLDSLKRAIFLVYEGEGLDRWLSLYLDAAMQSGRLDEAILALESFAINDKQALLSTPPSTMNALLEMLVDAEHSRLGDYDELRFRFLRALDSVGYSDRGGFDYTEPFRLRYVELLIEREQFESAKQVAASITSPDSLLEMHVLHSFDPIRADSLFDDGMDILEFYRREIQRVQRKIESSPDNFLGRIRLVQLFISVGDFSAARTYLENSYEEFIAKEITQSEKDIIVKMYEVQRSLIFQYLEDKAGIEAFEYSSLTNTAALINSSLYYLNFGDYDKAIYLANMAQGVSSEGSLVAQMVKVCAYATIGDLNMARSIVGDMAVNFADNRYAMQYAFLCIDDDDNAAAILIERLENPITAFEAIVSFQSFQETDRVRGVHEIAMSKRFARIAERSDVKVALNRTGRVLNLPIYSTATH